MPAAISARRAHGGSGHTVGPRELGRLGLLDALDYLALLAAEAPERYDRGHASGWHGSWRSRLLWPRTRSLWPLGAFGDSPPASRSRRVTCCGRWSSDGTRRMGSEAGGSLPDRPLGC